jgi:hypothetical protein
VLKRERAQLALQFEECLDGGADADRRSGRDVWHRPDQWPLGRTADKASASFVTRLAFFPFGGIIFLLLWSLLFVRDEIDSEEFKKRGQDLLSR